MRNLCYSHRTATILVGGLCALVLAAGITVTAMAHRDRHAAASRSTPSVSGCTTTVPKDAKASSKPASAYHPSYITPPDTPLEQQIDSEWASNEQQSVTAAAEVLVVPTPAYSAAYPSVPATDTSSPIAYADAFVAELLSTTFRTDTPSALWAWVQAESAPNTLPGVPPSVQDKTLYASVADPDLGGTGGTSPIPSAAGWARDAAAKITWRVSNLAASYDQQWSQLVSEGFVPRDPLMSMLDISGDLTVSEPETVQQTVTNTEGPRTQAHKIARTVSRTVEQSTVEHFAFDVTLGSALHHPGYGAVAVDNWMVSR